MNSPAREQIREAIRAAGPVNCAIILDMIPSLEQIIGKKEYAGGFKSVESSGKYLHVLTHFFQSLASAAPVVILVDDLQFADRSSLTLLSALIQSLKKSKILCLATRRPQPDENAVVMLNSLGKKIRIDNIELKALQEETVNLIIADILYVNLEVSMPMTGFLYRRTGGNALFVVELLRFMYDTKVLNFDEHTRTWNCEEDQMGRIWKYKDFEALFFDKLAHAPKHLQEGLKVAACFGSRFDAKVLELAMAAPAYELVNAATASGLIFPVNGNKRIYRFAHNGIRQGCYSLIPVDERTSFHLAIGRLLWKRFNDEDLYEYIEVVRGQMKMGKTLVTDQKERYDVASLGLRAAEKGLEWSGFHIALECLEFGLSLLSDDCWHEQYDLSLALHNSCAEVGLMAGSFSRSLELVDAVVRNARVFDDKWQAYCTKLYALGSTDETNRSIDVGLDIIGQLGEALPVNPSPRYVQREYLKMQRFMNNKTPEMLLRLPTLNDQRMAAVIQVINLIFSPAFLGRPYLAALLAMRGMRITVSHGLCAVSSFICGMYGMLLCSYGDVVDEGTRYGDAAIQLLERFETKQWAPQVYVAVYGCIYCCTKDIRFCVDYLCRGQLVAFETGDNQSVTLNGNARTSYLFALGGPLAQLKKEMETYSDEIELLNQTSMLKVQRTFAYLISATESVSSTEDLLMRLHRDALCVEEAPSGLEWDCWQHFQFSLLAFVMGDAELANQQAEKGAEMDKSPFKTVVIALFHLFYGLTHLALYRTTGKNKLKAVAAARSRIRKIDVLARANPQFCLGKVYLLRAEVAAFIGNHDEAHALYVTAFALFGTENSLMELAIAKEFPPGRNMLERGKTDIAITYL